MELEETFGYQLGQKRMQMKLSEPALAEQINTLRSHDKYSENDVLDWESNAVVPEQDVIDALVTILITRNTKMENREAVEEQFRAAAEATRGAIDRDRAPPRTANFGRMLSALRIEHDRMTEETLAKELSSLLRRSFTGDEIWRLEHSASHDKELFRALVSFYTDKDLIAEPDAREMRRNYEMHLPQAGRIAGSARTLQEAHAQLLQILVGKEHILGRANKLRFIVDTKHWKKALQTMYDRVPSSPDADKIKGLLGQIDGYKLELDNLFREFSVKINELTSSRARETGDSRDTFPHDIIQTGSWSHDLSYVFSNTMTSPEILRETLKQRSTAYVSTDKKKELLIEDIVACFTKILGHVGSSKAQERTIT